MANKNYTSGSTLTYEDLNDLQDEYIDGVYTPWTAVGGCSFYVYPTAERYPLYGAPTLDEHGSTWPQNGVLASWLDFSYYPTSYNGDVRDLQLRLVAHVATDGYAINNLLTSVSLKAVSVLSLENNPLNTSVQRYALTGTENGKITFPIITDTFKPLRYDGAAFNFPNSGLYTIELLVGIPALGTPVAAAVNVYLQRRAV